MTIIQKKKLLFTFGASINYRIIKIITLLLKSYELKNYDINVILPNKKLKKYFIFKRKKKFKLFINPSIITIKKLYKSSKVAVCAGGIQLSELIINKVIPIALSKNFKEEKNISFFLKLHLCHKLNLNKSLFSLKKNLIRKIQVIYTNQKIAKYRYHLLDDLGALRTSKIILSNN